MVAALAGRIIPAALPGPEVATAAARVVRAVQVARAAQVAVDVHVARRRDLAHHVKAYN
jgi:hypothetical protein